jgi:hypothetical protein
MICEAQDDATGAYTESYVPGPANRKIVVGVEANESDLQRWGRAAALRRQQLPAWIKRSLDERAELEDQRRSARLRDAV